MRATTGGMTTTQEGDNVTDYRTIIIKLLNDWVLNGTTENDKQRRTDMTWRLMEEIELDITQGRVA